ncbi:alkaline phosphatase family protein [Streptomyces sp. NPDC059104]|uniref:alkaline phosphatase family protein n=1 Tax=Streptomyces sp. NPDC059104 TaxID=3346729 RepID=UPI0036CD2D71
MRSERAGSRPERVATARRLACLAVAAGLALAGCTSGTTPPPAASAPAERLPRPEKTVVVVFENKQYSRIIDNPQAPYINQLAKGGASFTRMIANSPASQPNYYQMFSGGNQGRTDNNCYPDKVDAPNLGRALLDKNLGFAGYSEGLPQEGSDACTSGNYARKHNPWAGFANLPPSTNKPFSAFPGDFSTLPTVSFVVPDLCNDMHNEDQGCTIGVGDSWLKANLDAYAQWAMNHNSLLVVIFDEGTREDARIPLVFHGPMVKPGSYSQLLNHYGVLRTLEDMYALPHSGNAASAAPISGIWQ